MRIIKSFTKDIDLLSVREVQDNSGILTLLEVEFHGGEMDDMVHLEYQRKNNSSTSDVPRSFIRISFYENNVCIDAYDLFELNSATGEWVWIGKK